MMVADAENRPTLAEIVRTTGIPRGTAHAIAGSLCQQHWLLRHPDNTFGLGPGFLSLSRRAVRVDTLSTAATPALTALAEATGMPTFLARRVGETIAITDHADPGPDCPDPDRPGPPPADQRIPLRPPLCREFVAWAGGDERARWLSRAPADQRPRLTAVLDAIAERGYSIERITDHHRALLEDLGDLDAMPAQLRTRMAGIVSELVAIDYLPDELVGEVGAVSVGAPVVDEAGAVIAALVARPDRVMQATELTVLGDAVRAAADAVSAKL